MIRNPVFLIAVFIFIGFGAAFGEANESGKKSSPENAVPESATVTNKSVSTNKSCPDQKTGSPEAKAGDVVCCPVMGGKFEVRAKSPFAEIGGKKIYVCCPGCVGTLKADPEKYLKKTEKPEKPEKPPGSRCH